MSSRSRIPASDAKSEDTDVRPVDASNEDAASVRDRSVDTAPANTIAGTLTRHPGEFARRAPSTDREADAGDGPVPVPGDGDSGFDVGTGPRRRSAASHPAAVDSSSATAVGSHSSAAGRVSRRRESRLNRLNRRRQRRASPSHSQTPEPAPAGCVNSPRRGGSLEHAAAGSARPRRYGTGPSIIRAAPRGTPPAPAAGQTRRDRIRPGDLRLAAADGPVRSRAGVSSAFCWSKRNPRSLATPQFPAATFPTTYCVQGEQYPKPYPVLATSQTVEFTPTVATHAEKKPCVLTAWLQKFKACRKGAAAPGCHHGHSAPCCSGCTCHTAKTESAMASPQANLASPQGNSGAQTARGPSLQMAPISSTGTKPGDVAEEGKLFERVSFESFDESPQR